MSMRDSMSATMVLFINYLEKECSHSWECDGDDEQKPYHCVSVDTVSEEYRCREYNHSQIDDNEDDKPWVRSNPREFTARDMDASFICLFEPEMVPEHSEENSLENSDSERS